MVEDRTRRLLRARLAREQAGLDALRSRPVLVRPETMLAPHQVRLDGLVGRGRRTTAGSVGTPVRTTARPRGRGIIMLGISPTR